MDTAGPHYGQVQVLRNLQRQPIILTQIRQNEVKLMKNRR